MAINKVVYGNNTLIDLTSDTVTADKLMQGYTAHDASGAIITGTATGGGGSVTQDQDGFIVLPPDGGGGGSTGGLEYESGTWTPAEDVAITWINFSNTHTTTPFFYAIWDGTGTYDSTTYSNYSTMFFSGELMFGEPIYAGENNANYARSAVAYRSSNASVITGTAYGSTGSDSVSVDSSYGYSRYWASPTGIRATSASDSRYWRAGRTYKWIAIWAPTT